LSANESGHSAAVLTEIRGAGGRGKTIVTSTILLPVD
jgi:hypothetical protein